MVQSAQLLLCQYFPDHKVFSNTTAAACEAARLPLGGRGGRGDRVTQVCGLGERVPIKIKTGEREAEGGEPAAGPNTSNRGTHTHARTRVRKHTRTHARTE